jgi:hypothetical protein
MALGRISGPLLKANLERLGVDLAFETDLLYLNVADGNQRVGVNTNNPQYDLDVNGTTQTTNLEVSTLANIADISISSNTISTTNSVLNLATADTVVYNNSVKIDSIDIDTNVITTNETSADLVLRANAAGRIYIPDNNVEIANTLTVNGLTTTQSIQAAGDIDVTGDVTVTQDLQVDRSAQFENIRIHQNTISTTDTESNLDISTSGTGTVEILADTNIYGNLHATGNITADGDITIGDADTDNIILNGEIASNIVPDQDNTYTLGTDAKRWANIWVNNFVAGDIETDALEVDGVDLALRPGNTLYVAENGNDINTGTHPQDPKASIKAALEIATPGETVYVYPGNYTEVFPLTVKAGVTIKGYGIRSVNISPTTETQYNDAFLLNGESTIEDITVKDFYSGGNFFRVTNIPDTSTIKVNVGTSPFAHSYVSGGTIDSDDSTIANITGATYDHTTGELTITTDVPHDTYVGANLFLKDLTFSCNGGTRVFPDNGYAFRFATDFEVTTRSPYIRNVTVLTFGSTSDASDPRGYNAGDAGKGAYIDGAYATAASKEASMLFHSATFICPGVDAITATNGARIEWLNSFTYFANKSFNAFDSNDGLKGTGQTALRVDGLSGSFAASETVSYYDTDGVTLLASGTIADKDADGKFYIDGKVVGFETAAERGGKTIAANGDAQLSTSIKKMGTASLLLDGTGDYASITSQADFGFGTGDFTVEGWMYLDATTGVQTFTDFRAGVDTNTAVWIYADGADAKVNVGNSTVMSATTALSATTWHHIALTRSGTSTRLFVDGVIVDTYTDSNDYGNTKPVYIGAEHDAGGALDGNIDDVRVIKGTAVYTAGFTPTNLPLPVTSQTVLMARFDGDNASTTFEDDVVLAQDIRFSGGATATGITLADYTDFGAEIRSIASASVYGKYGLYGDGPGVLMYAIGHNLAYIGTEEFEDNEPTAVIQENEVVELNGARIRYTSVDHQGDFRVGDLFYVDQQTGTITFSSANFQVQSTSGLTFTDGGNTTFIDGTTVDTGNISIHDNTIETTSGDLNVTAASGEINLQDDVSVTGNVDVTGNVTVGGNITIGDSNTDDLDINAEVISDIIPDIPSTYNLGSATKTWKNLYAGKAEIDSIRINENYITTNETNADLELRANGTGKVYVPLNDVELRNDLTVDGLTTLSNTTINGTISHTGNTTQTGVTSLTGDMTVSGTATINSEAQFENIQINDNYITTTDTSSDLELRANGTGRILVPINDVQLLNDLTVNGVGYFADIDSTGTITANSFSTGDILIDDNFITTTQASSNLELLANGTGKILVPSNNVQIDNDLDVNGTTNLKNTNITGTLIHTGNTVQTGIFNLTGFATVTGDLNVTGQTQFENIQINDNYITTTETSSDLELRANGTGSIFIPSNNVIMSQDVTISGTANIQDLNSSGTITANSFSTGNILIDDNFITTTETSSDLELRANGTGSIVIDDLKFNTNIIESDSTDIVLSPGTGIVEVDSTAAVILPKGTELERPGSPTTGMIRYNTDDNAFEGYNGTNWVVLDKGPIDLDKDTYITAELNPGDNDNTIRFYTNGTVSADLNSTRFRADKAIIDDIQIDGNLISTVTVDTDLELTANGTGSVKFDNFAFKDSTITNTVANATTIFANTTDGYVKIDSTNGFVLPVGDTTNRPPLAYTETGMMRYNTNDSRVEVWDGIQWTGVAGAASGISLNDATNIAIETVLIFG